MIVPCSPVLDVTFFWDGFLKEDRDSPPPPKQNASLTPNHVQGKKTNMQKDLNNDCFADSRLKFPMQLQVCHNSQSSHFYWPGVMSHYLYILGDQTSNVTNLWVDFEGPISPTSYLLGGSPSDRWNLWGECLKAFEEKQKTRWGWEQQKMREPRVEVVRNP